MSEISLEFPSGSVPLSSHFYIERPPLEAFAYQHISQPGSLTRIQAPDKMGKSSLILRVIARAVGVGYRSVVVDFQQADGEILNDINKLLRWFCTYVSLQLNLTAELDQYWYAERGNKVSCTLFFEQFLFATIDSPLVLLLDSMQEITNVEVTREFLSLLRFWHERAKHSEIWQKLRLVIVYSPQVYPFNVGFRLKLPEFTCEQVQQLAQCHELNWTDEVRIQQTTALMSKIGGHPYLVRLALYHLCCQPITLEQLLQDAPTLTGIYGDYLWDKLVTLKKYPNLAAAFRQVVTTEGVTLEAEVAYQLEMMGLIRLEGNLVMPRCQLYRHYFSLHLRDKREKFLSDGRIKTSLLQKLERDNQDLQTLADDLEF